MSDSLRAWVEVSFNVVYLVVVWSLVVLMWRRRAVVAPGNRRVAALFLGAFALLALGDTGHVGFRALGFAVGNLEAVVDVLGLSLGLVGTGALATAVTVTFFYALMVEIWRVRFGRRYDAFALLLLAMVLVRFALMSLPANEWNRIVPPQPWSTYRNLPLMVLGLGVAYLILRDARAAGDRAFLGIGAMIVASYAFYVPVIFWVQQMPLLGMLMIPKTLAYLGVAVIAYRAFYQPRRAMVPS